MTNWRDVENVLITDRIMHQRWREEHGQTFGAAGCGRRIDPRSVNVPAPPDQQPRGIPIGAKEIKADAAFWSLWKIDGKQLRKDGYRVVKVDRRWRVYRGEW